MKCSSPPPRVLRSVRPKGDDRGQSQIAAPAADGFEPWADDAERQVLDKRLPAGLGYYRLVSRLENDLEIELPAALLEEVVTVGDLLDFCLVRVGHTCGETPELAARVLQLYLSADASCR